MNSVFEFDEQKSLSNKEKHGVDFIEAQDLWSGGILITSPAKNLSDEQRWAAIGKLGERHWVAFYTMRGDVIRLISVRRARKGEIEYYESC